MRWATFRAAGSDADRVGVLLGDQIHALPSGVTLLDLLGDDGERLTAAGERATTEPVDVFELSTVRLRPPIARPPSVRDFYAFEQHVKTARARRGLEMDPDWYELPVFYFSNPAAIVGPDDPVRIAPGSREMDFELEVAAIVGMGGRDLEPNAADRHIAGFCVMNDWSARDVQRREMKLSMGPVKGKDFATTLGPLLVTPDELEPYRRGQAYDLTMTAWVNGTEYSCASLADIYWSFGQMLAYASRGTELVPGDVIGSGTCGTGCILELSLVHGSDSYPWLKDGDLVELEVEHLGRIRNTVVAGAEPGPLWPTARGIPSETLLRLRAVEDRLARLARVVPASGLTEPDQASGERWDWGQVWAHVAEFPAYWTAQIRAVLSTAPDGEPPPFGRVKSDPARIGAIERDRGLAASELMNRLRPQLEEVRRLVRALTPDDLARKVTHSTLGVLGMDRVLEEFVIGHLEEHAEQLESLVQRTDQERS